MLNSVSILNYAWLLALLGAFVFALPQAGSGLNDAGTALGDSGLKELGSPEKHLPPFLNSETGPASGSNFNVGDTDGIGDNGDDLQPIPTMRMPDIPTMAPTPARKFDENTPAQKAEIVGMARFTKGDKTSNADDLLIVVNEFNGRSVVRQSVCYNFIRPSPKSRGFDAYCYDMSDYEVVSGTPETMTSDQLYLLRDKLQDMTEAMFHGRYEWRYTMTAHSIEIIDAVPYSIEFRGEKWNSARISLRKDDWSSVDSRTRPDDRSVVAWKPSYERSRAIRPYYWDEAKQVVKTITGGIF